MPAAEIIEPVAGSSNSDEINTEVTPRISNVVNANADNEIIDVRELLEIPYLSPLTCHLQALDEYPQDKQELSAETRQAGAGGPSILDLTTPSLSGAQEDKVQGADKPKQENTGSVKG